jgi:hypothetical protein
MIGEWLVTLLLYWSGKAIFHRGSEWIIGSLARKLASGEEWEYTLQGRYTISDA